MVSGDSEAKVEAIPPFRYQDGRLFIADQPLAGLAERFGTPFFLVDESRLTRNYEAIADGLSAAGAEVRVRYCAKTNNEAGVLSVLARLGSGMLASYPEEVELAVESGFAPDKVAYQRPVLVDREVRAALAAGVRYFHAYRLSDLRVLEREAEREQGEVRVSLRLRNNTLRLRLSPLNFMSRRLGFHASDILAAAGFIHRSRRLKLVSINFYRGTQQDSPKNYRDLLKKSFALAAEIRARFGIVLEEINLGGGVPSQTLRRNGLTKLAARLADEHPPVDSTEGLRAFARSLASQYQEQMRESAFEPPPAIGLEPGRSIVGNAGFLVTRVIAAEGDWLFLDASHNFLPESLLLFSRRILPGALSDGGERRYYHLSGNTLNTGDVIDLRRRLPVSGAGDLLVFCDAGAYSISRSSRYAGLCPAVFLLQEDRAFRMIRRREETRDLHAPMILEAKEPGIRAR